MCVELVRQDEENYGNDSIYRIFMLSTASTHKPSVYRVVGDN